jgi:PAS domain S-box-containing protein
MNAIIAWYETLFTSLPLPLLEVWGRFAYIVGLFLAICAFGGFTFRIGGRWGFGRTRQTWDAKSFLSLPLTFVLIIAGGYIGSFIVLVPGAQTFESLKDLVVLLCIVLLGYPALITVPIAYGLSDLIEGVPPEFLLAWLPGYFVNPACFWIAHQFLGKNPDFRMARTWWRYLAAAVLFMALEPVLWGYVCSDQFPSGISYHRITPALMFTTSITWVMGPLAFLAALPLARRFGWFWAEVPGRVRERAIGSNALTWESGRGEARDGADPVRQGVPIRIFIFTPFIALLLVMVGVTAIVALQTADDDATMLATKLHQAVSANIRMRLDDYFARAPSPAGAEREDALSSVMRSQAAGTNGRAFILDTTGKMVASSASAADPVVESAIAALARRTGLSGLSVTGVEFPFDYVSAKPLSRETWLTYASAYRDDSNGQHWVLVTAMPEAFYLAGLRKANSRSAMVFALALVLSLVLGAALASMMTAPLRHMARATRTMAHGDMSVRVAGSKLEELDALAESFNGMAARLKKSFDDLVGEVETRKSRERELKESEARLRVSEERLQLAIDAAGLGIWDWNIEQDRLVWDDSMYRLYGVHKDEFSGAFDAWSRCLVPEDMARANADVEAAVRGERKFASDFRVRRADGAIRIIRGVGQIVRSPDGRPVRMVGVNRDVTDLINAEREREQLVHDLRRSASYLAEAEKLSDTGCWARNTRTGEVFWSAGQWRIFGLDPATAQLSHQLFVDLVHPEDRAFVEASNTQAVRDKKTFNISYRAMLRDGTVKNLHSVGTPFDESGEEFIGVTTDETERVRANAAVQEAQAELAQVARLTTMGELAASIAHEINQPLTAVVSYGHGALRWLDHTPPNLEEITESLKGIVEEGTRAGEVIARVRALLKHRKPNYVALDTNDAIREVLALTGSALRSRSVAVQTTLPADLPPALGDRVQLQQVVMNLIMNGADAMSSVTEQPRVLQIETQVGGKGSIQVTIKDSGAGIQEAIRDRIFDPLFTTKPTGMGMGLSICRSIVESHGGKLWASPGTAHGTEFQFTIPIAGSR